MKANLSRIASVLLICFLLGVAACKKKTTTTNTPSSGCGAGISFCVLIGSEQISGTAKYLVLNSGTRHRIYWEEGSGTSYRNVELDIYTSSLTPGTYNFSTSPGAGQASLQYYTTGKSYEASTGSVVITAASATSVSGTFSGSVTNASDTRTVSNGNIVNVGP